MNTLDRFALPRLRHTMCSIHTVTCTVGLDTVLGHRRLTLWREPLLIEYLKTDGLRMCLFQQAFRVSTMTGFCTHREFIVIPCLRYLPAQITSSVRLSLPHRNCSGYIEV